MKSNKLHSEKSLEYHLSKVDRTNPIHFKTKNDYFYQNADIIINSSSNVFDNTYVDVLQTIGSDNAKTTSNSSKKKMNSCLTLSNKTVKHPLKFPKPFHKHSHTHNNLLTNTTNNNCQTEFVRKSKETFSSLNDFNLFNTVSTINLTTNSNDETNEKLITNPFNMTITNDKEEVKSFSNKPNQRKSVFNIEDFHHIYSNYIDKKKKKKDNEISFKDKELAEFYIKTIRLQKLSNQLPLLKDKINDMIIANEKITRRRIKHLSINSNNTNIELIKNDPLVNTYEDINHKLGFETKKTMYKLSKEFNKNEINENKISNKYNNDNKNAKQINKPKIKFFGNSKILKIPKLITETIEAVDNNNLGISRSKTSIKDLLNNNVTNIHKLNVLNALSTPKHLNNNFSPKINKLVSECKTLQHQNVKLNNNLKKSRNYFNKKSLYINPKSAFIL